MTYEYACQACGHTWEAEQSIKDAALKKCVSCGASKAKRLVSGGTGFLLKGGGWYADGYGSSSASKPSGDSEGSSASKASGDGAAKKSEAAGSDSKSSDAKSGDSKSSDSKSSDSGAAKTSESTTKSTTSAAS